MKPTQSTPALQRSPGCVEVGEFVGVRNSPRAIFLREQGRRPASAGVRNATPRCAGSAVVLAPRSRRKTPFARCAHYGQTVSARQITQRAARADLMAALLAAAYSPRHWPARSLAEPTVHFLRRTSRWCPQGRGWAAAGRACAATRSGGLVAARASALRQLTRCVCLSAVSAANVASYVTGHKTEHRSAVAAQRRPPHRSARRQPSLGLASADCRGCLRDTLNPSKAQHLACCGPTRFMRHGSREARWSH